MVVVIYGISLENSTNKSIIHFLICIELILCNSGLLEVAKLQYLVDSAWHENWMWTTGEIWLKTLRKETSVQPCENKHCLLKKKAISIIVFFGMDTTSIIIKPKTFYQPKSSIKFFYHFICCRRRPSFKRKQTRNRRAMKKTWSKWVEVILVQCWYWTGYPMSVLLVRISKFHLIRIQYNNACACNHNKTEVWWNQRRWIICQCSSQAKTVKVQLGLKILPKYLKHLFP